MSTSLCIDELAEQILCELRHAPEHSRVGENLVNAVVDAVVQANVDLDSITLQDVKTLLSHVCRYTRDRTTSHFPLAAF